MEAMGGGASFTDGEWESICQLLSIDHDSDHGDGEGLVSLLIGDSNPSISLDEQLGFQSLISSNSFSQLSCCSSDLSNSPSNMHFMQTYSSIDDQISPISTPLDRLFADDRPLVNSSQIEDEIEPQPEIPAPKKRSRPAKNNNVEKGKRKMQAKKMKSEDLPEKSSVEMSDGDSNGSQRLMNEETLNLKGKKRANRGAATDPQSLYARKRRERINERLKVLQNLVPNGTKVDISTMLEEAVNYVKFLQLQIKLLSSDEMWMYAPLAYNGFDVGVYNEPRRGYY